MPLLDLLLLKSGLSRSVEHERTTSFLLGHIAEIGMLTPLVRVLDEPTAQKLVTRSGEYLLNKLEAELGFEATQHILSVAGIGLDSHLSVYNIYETRMARNRDRRSCDEQDYGYQLTTRERLIDRAQRLDSITMTIGKFGFSAYRTHEKQMLNAICDMLPTEGRDYE